MSHSTPLSYQSEFKLNGLRKDAAPEARTAVIRAYCQAHGMVSEEWITFWARRFQPRLSKTEFNALINQLARGRAMAIAARPFSG